MTSDQVTPVPIGEPFPCGTGWDGGTGTTWRSDTRRHITAILFTQRQAVSPAAPL